ncbi:FAD-binding protein [Rubrobacter marinus]|uniref:FAD-binding protein n=1 Tax=Rubrobacter marinus TaxID=2653852 RepID=A0A6G8PWC7_9ACTN|nr:FAD-binding protein [Rubrobacter marinus]QIN78512.1 FAD-binding protein [Rubrobacter marinus]
MAPEERALVTDVVVVGSGACGMAAAIAARQQGRRSSCWRKSRTWGERGPEHRLRTRLIHTVSGGGRRRRLPEAMAEDIMRQTGYQSDGELVLHLARESSGLIDWLVDDLGVELYLVTDYMHVGHSVHRLHAPASREGADLVKDLRQAIKDFGVSLKTGMPVKRLLTADDGSVVGVEAEEAGQKLRVEAKKVILASNGFAANREMLLRYCPDIADAPYFGAPGNTGEGIAWGEGLGAAVEHMGAYQGYAAVCENGILVSWTTVEKGGIVVDGDGRRFGDETSGYSAFVPEVQRHTDGPIYVIFDQRIMESVRDREPRFRGLVEEGFVKEAATVDELAALHDMPRDDLEETLARYNAAAEAGVDEFGRKDFGAAPLRFPLHVARASTGLFHTQGGLRINTNAQPLRTDGSPVENLYAGGGVAVGISGADGGRGYSSGNGLLTALGWGKIAGEHAGRSAGKRG